MTELSELSASDRNNKLRMSMNSSASKPSLQHNGDESLFSKTPGSNNSSS